MATAPGDADRGETDRREREIDDRWPGSDPQAADFRA
jgi:hypothetical protein